MGAASKFLTSQINVLHSTLFYYAVSITHFQSNSVGCLMTIHQSPSVLCAVHNFQSLTRTVNICVGHSSLKLES